MESILSSDLVMHFVYGTYIWIWPYFIGWQKSKEEQNLTKSMQYRIHPITLGRTICSSVLPNKNHSFMKLYPCKQPWGFVKSQSSDQRGTKPHPHEQWRTGWGRCFLSSWNFTFLTYWWLCAAITFLKSLGLTISSKKMLKHTIFSGTVSNCLVLIYILGLVRKRVVKCFLLHESNHLAWPLCPYHIRCHWHMRTQKLPSLFRAWPWSTIDLLLLGKHAGSS